MNLIAEGLPDKQREILIHTANGLTRKEAARKMGCSPQNASQLMDAVCFKLRARNAPQAIAIAFQQGLLRTLCLLALITAGAVTSIPVAQADDDPLIRRARSRPNPRLTRRVRRTVCGVAIMPNDQGFIDYFGLSHTLVWDDALYVVYQ
ncbi:hypothetical protein PHACT_12730 [Pseudohongiella acticola]|uniref:HTH luxR-type domain-containing protein n=1 Tax=Pseudohongiella acticola TaxID=1524254 RepID=A0A1E8CGI2_9GAMM|nr:helix-turn-helix transcriptional regulator [Pseudohongiella acticola]OFE11415.1 hypothetical protein PHACT_12730 [Pseudohongiella acticola]